MNFTDVSFFILLPVVFLIYWVLPHRFRWGLLLVASLYFYMSWNVKYIVLIMFTTGISYICALLLEKAQTQRQKTQCIIVCLVACLGVLGVFKYLNWVLEMFNRATSAIGIPLHAETLSLLLPVGISFYTFQTLAYVIDVYRGKVKAEKHFGIYTTFITFFPQLVAGPIERTESLLPQIRSEKTFDYDQAAYGMILMSWGFFKKIVIADQLAEYAYSIFAYSDKAGFAIVLGTLCFTFQIYCDFSGYSDIAIGTAKLFGINLCRNFHSPYFAKSIKEFWGRWHISLSSWFRDYVYIPCGGNRCSAIKQCRNLMVTFLLSGLWHGASSHFVIWGLLHGLFQCAGKLYAPYKKNNKTVLSDIASTVFVFVLCNFAWIFFRAEAVSHAIWYIQHMFDGISDPIAYFCTGFELIGIKNIKIFLSIVLPLVVLTVFDYISLKQDCIQLIRRQNIAVRWSIYILVTALWFFVWVTSLGTASSSNFIYFQF